MGCCTNPLPTLFLGMRYMIKAAHPHRTLSSSLYVFINPTIMVDQEVQNRSSTDGILDFSKFQLPAPFGHPEKVALNPACSRIGEDGKYKSTMLQFCLLKSRVEWSFTVSVNRAKVTRPSPHLRHDISSTPHLLTSPHLTSHREPNIFRKSSPPSWPPRRTPLLFSLKHPVAACVIAPLSNISSVSHCSLLLLPSMTLTKPRSSTTKS